MLRLLRRFLVFLRLMPPPKPPVLSGPAYEALLEETIRQHRESLRDVMFPPRSRTLLTVLRERQRQADNQPKE